jgi:hypothetical protein
MMEKRKAPQLICTKCRAFGSHMDLPGHRHPATRSGQHCGGSWQRVDVTRIAACSNCGATGRGEDGRCESCDGHGWVSNPPTPG